MNEIISSEKLPSLGHFSDVLKMCSDVLRCSLMFSDDHRRFWIFSRYSIDILLMFSRCSQDVCRIFSGCSDVSFGPGGIWWSFQMKVWTLKILRNPMIPNYSMIPAAAIRWSPSIWWSPAIRWSIGSMDFDNTKVYGDTFISDGLVNFRISLVQTNWKFNKIQCRILYRMKYFEQSPTWTLWQM